MNETTRSTANLLGALTLALGDELAEIAPSSSKLDATAAAALLSIGTRPGTSIGELARVVGREQSTTVRTVDRLERAQLVERAPADYDARRVELRLTTTGRAAYEEILEARMQVLEPLVEQLEDQSRVVLHDLLDRLLESLPRSREHAMRICRLCDHRLCRGASCPVGRSFTEVSA